MRQAGEKSQVAGLALASGILGVTAAFALFWMIFLPVAWASWLSFLACLFSAAPGTTFAGSSLRPRSPWASWRSSGLLARSSSPVAVRTTDASAPWIPRTPTTEGLPHGSSHSADYGVTPGMERYTPQVLVWWRTGMSHQVLAGTMVFCDISGFTALSERLATKGRVGSEAATGSVSSATSATCCSSLSTPGTAARSHRAVVGSLMSASGNGRRIVSRGCRPDCRGASYPESRRSPSSIQP